MALTYAVTKTDYNVTTSSVLSTGANAVGALSAGTLVAAFMDLEGHQRSFIPPAGAVYTQWNGAAGASGAVTLYGTSSGFTIPAGLSLYNGGSAASIVFPAVVSATVQAGSDGSASGPVKLVLSPGSGDLFNASSVMTYLLDQNAIVITVSGTL